MRAFLQVPRSLRTSLGEEEVRKEVGGENGASTGDEGGGKKRKRQVVS